jgi:iron complex outermembrane receptor protein
MPFRYRRLFVSVLLTLPASGVFAAETITTPEVSVTSEKLQPLPVLTSTDLDAADLQRLRANTSDTASLLDGQPGVSLYRAGGVSSLPSIHGMADDRIRIKVDGMDLISSCPNHMNSPLSYLAPTNVGTMKTYAGIAPVSLGGDSIGGTVVAKTKEPEFAESGQGVLVKGEAGVRYRSNGDGKSANVSATMATENFSATYSGATTQANNYKAADKFKNFTATGRTGHLLGQDEVGSTAYEARNHNLDFALKSGNHLVELKLGYQDIPYELYPNQRMDMLENEQTRINLRYLGQFDWGSFEARAYHERVSHTMDFGDDKMFLYTAGNTTQGMPMRTKGRTTGASAKFNIDLTAQDLLRVGAEYQRYTLLDWWPAVIGSMGMGPNDFTNINGGERDRAALYGEWEKHLTSKWVSLLGARYEQVETSAGMVHGYNLATAPTSVVGMDMMNQKRDAVGFNNSNRNKTDHNWDMTATARYTPDQTRDVEFGVARKVRSPNLYERYSWSTASMMAIMNNYVGDGNGYIGDVNLKSEKAYTASATFDWHAADRAWEAKATPFYTYVDDYIDAIQWNGTSNTARSPLQTNRFTVLKYANQSARLYGLDLSGHVPLGSNQFGQFGLKALLNYTRGENRDTGDDLYNIMPLNAKLTLTHKLGGWDNQLEWVGVTSKGNVSNVRNEIKTPGYGVLNLRGSYSWSRVRVDVGVENLFDKMYYLPLGGAYVGQGTTMGINSIPWGIAVPGMGRSIYAGVNVKF